MIGKLEGEWIILREDAISLHEHGGYGRPEGDTLKVAPEEALYLIGRNKIEVENYTFTSLLSLFCKNSAFLRKFLVYRDIRERGFVIQAGPHDFRVFKRGQKPGKGTSYYLIRVLSERDIVNFERIIQEAESARNMRKVFLLAVADDEEEITYYEIKINTPPDGGKPEINEKIKGTVYANTVLIKAEPDSVFESSLYGKRFDKEHRALSSVESLYLIKRGIIELESKNACEEFYRCALDSDHELKEKLAVYTDLRNLHNIPKTGYKFGHHFRVYSGGKMHSEVLVHALREGETMPMSVISRSVRLAHSVRKKMLFACVNKDSIQYIEFARMKL